MSPWEIERDVSGLDPLAITADQAAAGLDLTALLLARAKQIRQRMEQIATQWIAEHGPLEIGHIRYTTGFTKVVTCQNISQSVHWILEACDGDLGAFSHIYALNLSNTVPSTT